MDHRDAPADSIFPILILNARPAAGKTEVTRYLQNIPRNDRLARFRLGPLKILDDFPMLWAWFEEDDILEKAFHTSRLHSTPDYYFLDPVFWDVLIRRLSQDYEKWSRDAAGPGSALIEFSRGSGSGGYAQAYSQLSDHILENCAALYLQVSFEESKRKNLRRRNPDRPDSLLEHSLEEPKMERLYREDDWHEMVEGDPAYFIVRDHRIPYVVFENEDDVTTRGGEELGDRLELALNNLWERWIAR